MKYVPIFLLVLCIFKFSKCIPYNSTVLISKYAKVAVWGRNKTNAPEVEEGRNSKIWNHRLDPKSIGANTKIKNPAVAYQYPVYPGPDPKVHRQIEHVPGIGEVIVGQAQAQDRFEARPLFAYRNKFATAATYGPPPVPKPSPPMAKAPNRPPIAAPSPIAPPPPPSPIAPPPSSPPIAASPANSFSSFNNPPAPPISAPNPSEDLYNSPYSSYNPPDFKPDDTGDDFFYPPNVPSSEDSTDMKSSAESMPMEAPMDSTEPAKSSKPDSYASLGPPLSSYDMNDHNYDGGDDLSYGNHGQPQDPMAMYKDNHGPPDYPPKSEDDIYYPPDFPKDQVHYHDDMMKQPQDSMMAQPQDSMMAQPQNSMMAPPQDLMMMPQDNMVDSGKANADNADLAPPPAQDYEHGHAFPQYLYDQHHYDHHVYEEIPHTTMAPVKEDKRVSSTHYSYYYLGRKLWYIPLYFSIYFIIYVTVLILKSIARHKVKLKYKWYEHDTSAKEARSMDLDAIRDEELMDLQRNVSVGLENSTKKYNSVLAM